MDVSKRIPMDSLSPSEQLLFAERTAVIEFFAMVPRAEAQRMAYEEILKLRASADLLWAG